jgi:hypothetical protein
MKKVACIIVLLMLTVACGQATYIGEAQPQEIPVPSLHPVPPPPEPEYTPQEPSVEPSVMPTLHITVPQSPFVHRNTWQDGIIYLADSPYAFEPVYAGVRGRGNSTWWMGADKRPLLLRFAEARTMFGSEHEAESWILLANHFDRSLLRNYSALYFAANMNSTMMYVPAATNVHLYVNGQYMGVYTLTDERDINPGRLTLEWDENPAYSDFFFQMDMRAYEGGTVEGVDFLSVQGRLYEIRFPGSSALTHEHAEYARAFLHAVGDAIRSGDFEAVLAVIDLDTFIDFYLVHELYKNKDVYQTSVFMHISGQGDARRMFKGPVWDFDLGAGNMNEQEGGTGPEGMYTHIMNDWYRGLMAIPEFRAAVAARWQQLSADGIPHAMLARIRHVADHYRDDFERNFERHPIFGQHLGFIPHEKRAIHSFEGQVQHLIQWLERRIAYMDDYFG